MPTAIVTTIGAVNANSYVSLADSDLYFDDRLNSQGWTTAAADDKQRALLMAAARLNDENWRGDRVKTTQSLAWPRNDVEKKDAISYGTFGYGGGFGFYEAYLPTEIPRPVVLAQMELALAYLEGFDDGESGVIGSFSSDGISVSETGSKPTGALPTAVSRLLSGLIQGLRLQRA